MSVWRTLLVLLAVTAGVAFASGNFDATISRSDLFRKFFTWNTTTINTSYGIETSFLDAGLVKAGLVDAGAINVEGQVRITGPLVLVPTVAISMVNDSNRITWPGGLFVDAAAGGLRSNQALKATSTVDATTGYLLAAALTDTATAVTIANGCTGETVTWSNGSALFQFDVGTTCTGVTTTTVTFPAAAHAWGCDCWNIGAATNVRQSGGSATTAVLTNYGNTVATPTDWTDGADIQCHCRGG